MVVEQETGSSKRSRSWSTMVIFKVNEICLNKNIQVYSGIFMVRIKS
jgi:hypothetical protein